MDKAAEINEIHYEQKQLVEELKVLAANPTMENLIKIVDVAHKIRLMELQKYIIVSKPIPRHSLGSACRSKQTEERIKRKNGLIKFRLN